MGVSQIWAQYAPYLFEAEETYGYNIVIPFVNGEHVLKIREEQDPWSDYADTYYYFELCLNTEDLTHNQVSIILERIMGVFTNLSTENHSQLMRKLLIDEPLHPDSLFWDET